VEGATAEHAVTRVRTRGTAIAIACTAAIAVAAWPVRTIVPGLGGDWGWVSTLAYAFEHGLTFGEGMVWTYGPLGFLDTWYGPTLYYGDVFALAWLYAAIVQLLLAGTLLIALRRALPLALAALAAAVALAFIQDAPLALGFAWCVLLVTRERDGLALPLALGLLSGIMALGKLNQGGELIILAALALLAAPRRRDTFAFAGAALATAAVGWIATGQTLADAWPYARNGLELIAGYAAAMGRPDPAAHDWTIPVALALVAFALVLAWEAVRAAPTRRRGAGLLALCAVYLLLAFKEGFVLQDGPHIEAYFGDALVVFALLPLRGWRRALPLAGIVAGVLAFAAVAGGGKALRIVNPYANVAAVADQLHVLGSTAERERIRAGVRARIERLYSVPPRLLSAVGRHTTMLWPYLYGEVAWAYGLKLRPLPSLEPYATYTPQLDRLGARALADDDAAPQRILRAAMAVAPSLDGRHQAFEAPLTTLAIFCRYRQLDAVAPWQLLTRAPDRCDAPRQLAATTARWGEPVDVPAPRRRDALLLARVEGASEQGLERLRSLALRPQRRWIELDTVRYRLVAATAADGLLLGAPPQADYPDPFTMAPNPRQIAISRDGGQPDGQLRITFLEVRVKRR
jgi:hypothetical protein